MTEMGVRLNDLFVSRRELQREPESVEHGMMKSEGENQTLWTSSFKIPSSTFDISEVHGFEIIDCGKESAWGV